MSTIEPPVRDVNPETITPDKYHPLVNAYPGFKSERFVELRADIKAHGQLEPVVFHNGILLDGRNRVIACKDLGIPVRVVEFSDLLRCRGLDCTPEEYIESINGYRRHLTDDQRVMASLTIAEFIAAAKERQKRKPASVLAKTPKQKPINTRKTIAEKHKVSEHKVRQAQEVKKRTPDVADKVVAGEMTIKDATKAVSQTKPANPKSDRTPEEPFHILIASGELRDAVEALVRKLTKHWPPQSRPHIAEMLRAIAHQLEEGQRPKAEAAR